MKMIEQFKMTFRHVIRGDETIVVAADDWNAAGKLGVKYLTEKHKTDLNWRVVSFRYVGQVLV